MACISRVVRKWTCRSTTEQADLIIKQTGKLSTRFPGWEIAQRLDYLEVSTGKSGAAQGTVRWERISDNFVPHLSRWWVRNKVILGDLLSNQNKTGARANTHSTIWHSGGTFLVCQRGLRCISQIWAKSSPKLPKVFCDSVASLWSRELPIGTA